MSRAVVQAEGTATLLYDPAVIGEPGDWLFEPGILNEQGYLGSAAGGRGAAWYVDLPEAACVLRHYRRGGLPARLLTDQYLYFGRDRTRPFREWHLLTALRERELPVPRPLAARVCRTGVLYRGDILVERIPNARSLAEHVRAGTADTAMWDAVGRAIRTFHDHGVDHADLNAANILIDASGTVHLVDFDRGRLRKQCLCWRRDNVVRLRRHLEKLRGLDPGFAYRDEDLRALIAGYGPVNTR